jgi:DME family drug/metabolite transporter
VKLQSAAQGLHPMVGVVGASVLFGTSGTARSFLPDDAPSLGIAAMRLAIGAVPLVAFAFWVHRSSFRRPSWEIVIAGGAMALFQVLFFQSIALTGVAVGTMVTIGSGPIVATAVDFAVSRRISWSMATGVVVALAGLSILVFGSNPADGESFSLWGIASGVGAGACYAAYTHISKGLLTTGWSGAWVMAQSFSVSALLCSAFLFVVPMQWLSSSQSVMTVLYLGIATIAIPYLLYALSLARLSSALVVTLTLIEPVTATALGAFFLNEDITIVSWLGAAIVLCGLVYTGLTTDERQ